ncbi:MAG: response regulator [Planctomycetota bacterium]|jgi:CheY-like chemotaxis protein
MARPYSVLLVEDDDPLRRVLHELLRTWGWQVHATGEGDEAIALARKIVFDFSILDLHLPGINGCEVLRTINREVRPLPSIMISGEASEEETQIALQTGVFTLLRKPLDMSDLRLTLDHLIQHHFGQQGFGRQGFGKPGRPPSP